MHNPFGLYHTQLCFIKLVANSGKKLRLPHLPAKKNNNNKIKKLTFFSKNNVWKCGKHILDWQNRLHVEGSATPIFFKIDLSA